MRSVVLVTGLAIAVVLVAQVSPMSASNGPPPPTVNIHLSGGTGGNPPTTVEIQDRPYFGVCSNPAGRAPACDDSVMRWRLVGQPLGALQQVRIEDAPNHLRCFTSTVPITFTGGGQNPQESGSADDSCTADKFGVYWPYVVRLITVDTSGRETGEIDTTDPGGIIFP